MTLCRGWAPKYIRARTVCRRNPYGRRVGIKTRLVISHERWINIGVRGDSNFRSSRPKRTIRRRVIVHRTDDGPSILISHTWVRYPAGCDIYIYIIIIPRAFTATVICRDFTFDIYLWYRDRSVKWIFFIFFQMTFCTFLDYQRSMVKIDFIRFFLDGQTLILRTLLPVLWV